MNTSLRVPNPVEDAPTAALAERHTNVRRASALLRQSFSLIFLVALLAVGQSLSPAFLEWSNIVAVAYGISILGVIAIGQTLLLIMGDFDMSVVGVLSTSGIAALYTLPYGSGAAIAAGLGVGLAVGLLNGVVVTRTGASPFLVTLGTQLLLYGAGLAITQSRTLYGDRRAFDWLGQGWLFHLPVAVVVLIALTLGSQIFLSWTRFGRQMFAIGNGKEAARLSGVRVQRLRVIAFALSGLCAALGGLIMASRLNSITANAGSDFDFNSIIAAVIGGTSLFGGRGGTLRTFVGAMVMGLLDNVLILVGAGYATELMARGAVFLSIVSVDRLSRADA